MEQLLGKGAALSDHGSNPWEGERERKVSQKKGKGRGKGDTNPEAPKALEDMPPDEQQVECLKKLKKTRDLLQQCRTNYEEALEK